jgi:cytochrome c peroxidase
VACHQPGSGFSSLNGATLGVARGSLATAFGLRAPSQAAYSSEIPRFAFVTGPQGNLIPSGGQFWDGRADTLAQQALLPLLNPLEMNNPDVASVVAKVAAAPYAAQFTAVFGAAALSNPTQAFGQIGQAIAAFESAGVFDAFSSKYDAVIQGKATFSTAEQNGLALFQTPRNGCAACHRLNPASSNPRDSLFTNHLYVVEGIPRNTRIPANANAGFFDLGLCGPERSTPVVPAGVNASDLCGAFQVPSLRNVARRPALMHNGFFSNLTDVVAFYATRNSDPQRWYGVSGIPNDLPVQYQANLETRRPPFNHPAGNGPLLNATQISELVAFMNTLSDGYQP